MWWSNINQLNKTELLLNYISRYNAQRTAVGLIPTALYFFNTYYWSYDEFRVTLQQLKTQKKVVCKNNSFFVVGYIVTKYLGEPSEFYSLFSILYKYIKSPKTITQIAKRFRMSHKKVKQFMIEAQIRTPHITKVNS